MKQIITAILFVLSTALVAQKNPVEWQFYSKDLANNEYILYFKAKVEQGWYIYSQEIKETPPIPTTVRIDRSASYTIIGDVDERGKLIDEYDEMLDKNIKKYADQVTFIAKVKSNSNEPVLVNGLVEYMSCDHEKCLPPTKKKFQFRLSPSTTNSPIVIRKDTGIPTTTIASKNYSSSTYIASESTLNIPEAGVIQLATYGTQDASSSELNSMKGLPQQTISNNDRTTELEKSDYMVAANVMKYFRKGQEEQEKRLLAQKAAAEQKEAERKRAEEVQKAEEERRKAMEVIEPPVDWAFQMISQGEGVYELAATVKLADGWYIYAQNNEGDGPAPTQITFEPTNGVMFLEDKVTEVGNLRSEHDKVFDKQVNRYANEVSFRRKVKFVENKPVNGTIRFMTASDSQYLMPTTLNFTYNENAEAVLPVKKTIAGWWWVLGVIALALVGLSYALTFVDNKKNK